MNAPIDREWPESISVGSLEAGRLPDPLPSPTVPTTCAHCGLNFAPAEITMVFRYAPEATREQRGLGWKCATGHAYVTGETAKGMHAKAFGL